MWTANIYGCGDDKLPCFTGTMNMKTADAVYSSTSGNIFVLYKTLSQYQQNDTAGLKRLL